MSRGPECEACHGSRGRAGGRLSGSATGSAALPGRPTIGTTRRTGRSGGVGTAAYDGRVPATRPLVIAHRGASWAEPPGNTLAAFRAAAALGADWVELDVRRTADGGLAVHHDAELVDGRPIVELALGDLPADVPSLAAALDACAGMGVNVEIKNAPVDPDWDESRRVADEVVRVLAGRDPAALLVTSFDPGAVDRVRELHPGLPTGLLVHPGLAIDDAVVLAAERGHRAVHPWDPIVTEEHVTAAHEHGLAVNVWTVNEPSRMRTLVAWGVDGIITDRPDLARAVVG